MCLNESVSDRKRSYLRANAYAVPKWMDGVSELILNGVNERSEQMSSESSLVEVVVVVGNAQMTRVLVAGIIRATVMLL